MTGDRRKNLRSDRLGGLSPATNGYPESTAALSVPQLPPDVDTLTAALAYEAAGWYVLPVKRGTKHPGSLLGEGWPSRSSREPEQIVAWFAGTDHGIALHCGRSGAVLFDVDNPGALPDVLRRHRDSAPYQSTRPDTPDRGHSVFAMPPGRMLGNSTGRLGGAWGEVRGANGVIIVEPTQHPEGGEYRWRRAGPVPPLPGEIGALLDDASPAADAASDATVTTFLAECVGNARPELLQGMVRALRKRFDAGESRHQSTVTVLPTALKESRLGFYPAARAREVLGAMFLTEVGQPPVSAKQGAPRAGRIAVAEFNGMMAWAVGQALAAVSTRCALGWPRRCPTPWAGSTTYRPRSPCTPRSWQACLRLPGRAG